ncbi:MAG: addiction module toxin RelE [Variibacter sp.]|nr:addiction module toxin RelE [Variibacter sp.]
MRDAIQAGLSEAERLEMVHAIANDPTIGQLMPGTGGARKVRFSGRGKGKSGGYRVITYYAGDDVPVLMLAIINKGERSDLSKAEQNALRRELSAYADEYRRSARARGARRQEMP